MTESADTPATRIHPWDEQPDGPAPTPPVGAPRPAHAYSAQRDWPGYFAAVAGREPRDTLLYALELFASEGIPGTSPEPPLAVDLACGEGRDTAELLRRGWRVLATDGHPEAIQRLVVRTDLAHPERLTMQRCLFEDTHIPPAMLINASFALPFCPPEYFDALWQRITDALVPGGRFAGQLFGDRDTWASIADRSHHTRSQVQSLLAGFEIERFDEDEREGEDCSGDAKHWHCFHIVARKPLAPPG